MSRGKTMEQVFLEIAQNHSSAMQNGKMLASVFCDLSQDTQDQRLVRYFVECGGPAELLAAKGLSPAMQQARFQQTVNKISARTLIPEEAARRVCNAFWCATGGQSMVQPVPQPKPRTVPQPETRRMPQPETRRMPQPEVRAVPPQPKIQPQTAPSIPREQPPAPQQPVFPVKERFYMTKQEYENGGSYYVYFDDGTRQLVQFPPNAKNNQPGLPRRIEGGREVWVDKGKNRFYSSVVTLRDFSDSRLKSYSRTDLPESILVLIVYTAFGTLICAGFLLMVYLVNWLFEAALSFDLLKGIDYMGFSLSALKVYCKSVFTFPPDDIMDWASLGFMLFTQGSFFSLGSVAVSDSWDRRKEVLQEIQRRKNCPDRR